MNQNFFIIPKKSKKPSKDVLRFWRLDFHDIEKIIIKKEGYSKNIIRLLKVSTIKRERERGRERGIFQKHHSSAKGIDY